MNILSNESDYPSKTNSILSKKILIIEDSATVAEYATLLLTRAGYEVFIARDWAEANTLVFNSETKLDLILIDINLELSITGDRIASIYKSQRDKFGDQSHLSKVGIYLFSNLNETRLEELVRRTGVDGYIPKKKGLVGLVDQVQAYFNRALVC